MLEHCCWERMTGAIRMMQRFAACFHDTRCQELIEHEVVTLVSQRVFGIALGYEDLNDHDQLRHDPMMAVLAGKLEARRHDCAPVAGKSTLNRLELSRLEPTRYHKISHNPVAIRKLLVELFLEAHAKAPNEIILDLDATDDPVHGNRKGFFHGFYDCYCYLPLYIFCGRHLLVAKLRQANFDAAAGVVEEVARVAAQIRGRWPHVRILVRADSGFARDELMTWCEANGVHFVLGLAKNNRLIAEITSELRKLRRKAGSLASRPATSGTSGGKRARAGIDSGGSSPRPNSPGTRPIHVSLSARCRAPNARPSICTKRFTVLGATWRTVLRNANSISMPIAPRRPRCVPISCGYGLPPWPMCCCVPCAASVFMILGSRRRLAAPFVSNFSKSGLSSQSACGGSK